MIPSGFCSVDPKAQLVIESHSAVIVGGNRNGHSFSRTELQKCKGQIGPLAAVFGKHCHSGQLIFVELTNAVGAAFFRKGQKGPLVFPVDPGNLGPVIAERVGDGLEAAVIDPLINAVVVRGHWGQLHGCALRQRRLFSVEHIDVIGVGKKIKGSVPGYEALSRPAHPAEAAALCNHAGKMIGKHRAQENVGFAGNGDLSQDQGGCAALTGKYGDIVHCHHRH